MKYTITIDTDKLAGSSLGVRDVPELQFISEEAEKLYALEGKRNKLIHECAHEQARILGHAKDEYWQKSIPEALSATLSSFERAASIAAAIGYLRKVASENQTRAGQGLNFKEEP